MVQYVRQYDYMEVRRLKLSEFGCRLLHLKYLGLVTVTVYGYDRTMYGNHMGTARIV
jgi:hypothetical protein